ncbi:cell division protein ZipA C-terminal FtsZ-binding domain-containing protein [Usitatibacter palustris]|uniref:Cell division protein ZipA n=1 Tax=Usitatibacter palustris TaxID=2732487 RepID=A0A6M4H4D2_9PROT|nr:cell division protein ZipA C-terminal FtsZ-binding domain-containing protein [Usitatibacter palustris]QJR14135.1 Cell division protein ZipA [Usitatibacter palustris]
MSDLQLALLAVGAVVIAGVVAYNVMQERKARGRAERAFGSDHPDVLLDGGRREPKLGALPDSPPAPAEAPEPGMTRNTVLDDALPAALPVVSERIDTVAVILADDPVMREQLEPLLDALQSHTTAVNVEGIVDEQWQPVEQSTRDSWRELRAGLQLASRSGPLGEEEITTFNATLADFAASVGAVSQREAPSAAAARARDLDTFCADTDIEVAVNVVGQFGATFAMTRVKAIALEYGLSEVASGDLVRFDGQGVPLFSVRHFDRAGSRQESTYATGLTLALDLPHVANPDEALSEMVTLAEAYCTTLGGELVDDNRKPLSAAGLSAIRRQMEDVVRRMEAQGIPAGSSLAHRLFA